MLGRERENANFFAAFCHNSFDNGYPQGVLMAWNWRNCLGFGVVGRRGSKKL
jgi:hypothetical protein